MQIRSSQRPATKGGALVAAVALASVGLLWQARNASASTFTVPSSIPADCSRSVSTSLTNWIATVPDGSTIQFPANGCYSLDTTVTLSDRNNIVVNGGGSTFKRLTPSNESQNPRPQYSTNPMWQFEGGSNITLRNATIIGNYSPPPLGTPGQGQYTDHGVAIRGTQTAAVSKVTVKNVDGDTVAIDPDIAYACQYYGCDYTKAPPSRNVTVNHLNGSGAARQCASATAVDGLVFENSTLSNCQQVGLDLEVDAVGELMRNITVSGNTVSDTYFSQFSLPLGAEASAPNTVENITFSNNQATQPPATCLPSFWIGTYTTGTILNVTISGNNTATLGDGVRFTASSSTTADITGNTIVNSGNGACDNPNLTPPYSTPVRTNGIPGITVDNTNTFSGFGHGQDQNGQPPPPPQGHHVGG